MTVNNGDFLKAVVELVYPDGTIAQNIFHWRADLTTSWENAAMTGLVGTYLEEMYELLENQISDGIQMNPYTLYKVAFNDVDEKWEIVERLGEAVLDVTFLATDDAMANQMAATMSASTTRPKSRGRKFIPGLTDLAATGSQIIAGVLPHLANFAAAWITDIIVGFDGDLESGIVRTAVNEFLPFTLAVVNDIMGTQRKRKPGVGA